MAAKLCPTFQFVQVEEALLQTSGRTFQAGIERDQTLVRRLRASSCEQCVAGFVQMGPGFARHRQPSVIPGPGTLVMGTARGRCLAPEVRMSTAGMRTAFGCMPSWCPVISVLRPSLHVCAMLSLFVRLRFLLLGRQLGLETYRC